MHLLNCTVGLGVCALLIVCIAVGIDCELIDVSGVDAFNTCLGEGKKLTCIGDTIAVEVFPNPKTGKSSIAAVDEIIVIAIKIGKCGKTITGGLSTGQLGVITKQLIAIVNETIVVFVQNQQTIIFTDPTCLLCKTIAIMVEVDIGGG